jgi:acetyl-CoA synthetase
VLLPSLLHGIPVLAHRSKKFDPEEAFYIMEKYQVKNSFMPPTALKLMKSVKNPKSKYNYKLRSIGSGGESLGNSILEWYDYFIK